MCPHDIASTLQELGMIEVNTAGDVVIALNQKLITDHLSKQKASTTPQYVIDEEYLRWTPLVNKHSSSPDKSSPEKPSPLVSSLCALYNVASYHILCWFCNIAFTLSRV